MFSGIVGNIRGLAQSFVRSAAQIGRTAIETFGTLVETGLDYTRSQFDVDFASYSVQPFVTDEIRKLPRDQLIPGGYHVETDTKLTSKFKYDFKTTYEDLEGNIQDHYFSHISNQRMTQTEVEEIMDQHAADYTPEGFPFHSKPQMVASWVRAEERLQ